MTVSSDSLKTSNLRLAVLLLAAGEGSRLGGYPKSLLTKGGVTLTKRFMHEIQSLGPIETLVVTGFYPDAVEYEMNLLKKDISSSIAFVRNSNPEEGQSSSVRIGLESLQSNYDVLLIALCDQPNIGAMEIMSLLEQFQQRSGSEEIVLPIARGQRGNPVLFSRRVINQILDIPGMVCRKYMDQHPELIRTFVTNIEAYVLDVDTQQDIQSLGLDEISPLRAN